MSKKERKTSSEGFVDKKNDSKKAKKETPGNLYDEDGEDSNSSYSNDNEIIMHMDIRETLRTLQKLLEKKLGVSLKDYRFWLQDTQELEPHKNLVDQCVKGKGLVQINVEINNLLKRINILDVLKPTEDALEALAKTEQQHYKSDSSTSNDSENDNDENDDDNDDPDPDHKNENDNSSENTEEELSDKSIKSEHNEESSLTSPTSQTEKDQKPRLNWVLDSQFRKEQIRLQIPRDPLLWTVEQVQHWFSWAIQEFKLSNFNGRDWLLNGKDLCNLTHGEFTKKITQDPGNVFWTHLQLLKECKFVGVVQKVTTEKSNDFVPKKKRRSSKTPREPKIMRKSSSSGTGNLDADFDMMTPEIIQCTPGIYNMSTGNGQVQLWQFLLDILTDPEHTDIIKWVGEDGEFKLIDPESVARLWGERKNKPAMNYEKLSRALRYYYDGDMISKVSGKRFTYKFDCDLKVLIGYSASEISTMLNKGYVAPDLLPPRTL